MKKIRKAIQWTARVVFVLSLLLFGFSTMQIYMADSKVNQSLEQWEKQTKATKTESPVSVINENQLNPNQEAVETAIETSRSTPLYSEYPKKGEVFGKISIPSLNMDLPIIHGTDDEELDQGVGHYTGSVLPGFKDNSVLAGHRDTVFRGLGNIKEKDVVQVETIAGQFNYVVSETQVVDENDQTIIVPHDEAVLTLVTCYPFDYVGPAPQRFIVTAKLMNPEIQMN